MSAKSREYLYGHSIRYSAEKAKEARRFPIRTTYDLMRQRAFRVWAFSMTDAIKNIVAGYMTLKNRRALEEIRAHRQRLLNESRMHNPSWVSMANLRATLQAELSIVDAALDEFDGRAARPSE